MIITQEDIQSVIDKGIIEKLSSNLTVNKINSIILNMNDDDFKLFIDHDNTRDIRSKYLVRNDLSTKHNYYSKKAVCVYQILTEKYRSEIEKNFKHTTNLYSVYNISNLSYSNDMFLTFYYQNYSILIDIKNKDIMSIYDIKDVFKPIRPTDIRFKYIQTEIKKIGHIDTIFDKFTKWKLLYRSAKLSKIK